MVSKGRSPHRVPALDRDAYRYLPASTAYLPTARDMSMLNRAGFSSVNNRRIMGGLSQQFLATRTS